MLLERLLALAVFVLSGLLLLRLGPNAVRMWRIYAGTGQRRQQDAVGRAPAAPPDVTDRAAILGALGYQPLGQTRLVLPTGERFAWILAAEDAESYVILASIPRIGGPTGIYSAWLDGTWLCTIHPRGRPVDRPGFQVRIVSTTLEDAVSLHGEGLVRLKAVHGRPRPIQTMPDMLALDADYRTRFGGRWLKPQVVRGILPAIGAAILTGLSLVLVAVMYR